MANDYKTDQGKPPLLDALLPFYPALARLALMMQDAAEVHRLKGAVDPFNQWRQLPDAKRRLANAGARHLLKGPWVNDEVLKGHPHAALALFNVLASLTLHEEEQAAKGREAVIARELAAHRAALLPVDMCCGAPDARPLNHGVNPEVCRHLGGITAGHCVDCGRELLGQRLEERATVELALQGEFPAPGIQGPAGADWREHHQVAPRCQTMAGLGADQCLLAAGHPGAHHYATDDYS